MTESKCGNVAEATTVRKMGWSWKDLVNNTKSWFNDECHKASEEKWLAREWLLQSGWNKTKESIENCKETLRVIHTGNIKDNSRSWRKLQPS